MKEINPEEPNHLKPLIEIIKLCIASAWVKNERPVNLLISSKPESGKTFVLQLFSQIPKTAYLTDCTAYGIMKNLLADIETGNLRFIIIPDLIKPLSRKHSTVSDFIAFMNALIEEGVVTIFTYAIQIQRKNLKCGLITSLPSGELLDRRRRWIKLGFMSRMIPFTYSFNQEFVDFIFEQIQQRKYIDYKPIILKLEEREVEITPEQAKVLEPEARIIGKAQELYGFRAQRQLQNLAQANALLENRKFVTDEDIQKIKWLSKWINFDFNPLESLPL